MKTVEELMGGRKPVNPIGQCFDSAAWCLIDLGSKMTMCHGIGVSNMPGEEKDFIAHAWLEAMHEGQKVALDTTWMLAQPADLYRKNLQLSYVIQYNYHDFIKLWADRGFPGPYDKRIAAVTKEGKALACSTLKS